jgi:hypothetical protein
MDFVDGTDRKRIKVEAKWKGNIYVFPGLDIDTTTIGNVKEMIQEETDINPSRMRLLGLETGKVSDEYFLSRYEKKIKNEKLAMSVMGTPEAAIQIFESTVAIQDSVLNDFGHNFTPATGKHYIRQVNIH